jgi:sorting nexin-4
MTTEPLLHSAQSLLAHSSSHRSVIKLRDQKQLDFEELSAYLSAVVSERDRLAAVQTGHAGGPVGLGTYLRDQVDKIRGTDDIHTRRERIRKLDGRIKEVSQFPQYHEQRAEVSSCKTPSLPPMRPPMPSLTRS